MGLGLSFKKIGGCMSGVALECAGEGILGVESGFHCDAEKTQMAMVLIGQHSFFFFFSIRIDKIGKAALKLLVDQL